ncbi:hypothetical protein K443DRAFT_3518 [Laccaria amethystina LaAM-08-1]|uniref:Uncharacterized protein n=1 Tax=Laccaria amethystina LaAM-08-1 TaxID=1095629 RepID=A0A0C9XLS2_9AGAR|nr:hypothetical protein K443DRAFT_3518 [Laccaria amethystina LaAM-08-1]
MKLNVLFYDERPPTFHDLFAVAQQDSVHSSLAGNSTIFIAASPGADCGPNANTREESDTRTEGEETIKSPHQAHLLPSLTPVHTVSCLRSPFAQIRHSFLGRHLLPQVQALRSLKLQLIQQDCCVPPFRAIPIPLGVGGPGQQHARPLPLPPHNGQQFLVDPPLFGAGVGGERKREGVATTVTDSESVIHHPGPLPGVGVGVEGLVGLYDAPRDTSGAAMQTKPETEGSYDAAPSIIQGRAEAWELELGETVQRVGAMSAGAGVGGSGVVRMGRGRKVSAKVGGVSEGGQSIEEKDNDEEKGKGKAEGNGRERESQSGKHKRRRRETKREGKGRRRGREETELMQPLDLNSHSTLDSYSSLDSHTTEQDVSNSTEHDLTALRATLTTHQEAIDERELGLAVRQEGIEGMVVKVREVQRAVDYREEAVAQRVETVGWREKVVEERENAVERRERDVQESE